MNNLLYSIVALIIFPENSQPENMVYVEGNHEIKGFYIDKYEVTVSDFREFVEATNYKTVAEIEGGYRQYNPTGQSYKIVTGSNWRLPNDQKTLGISEDSLFSLMAKYPVSHLAPKDAAAYAKWAGKRLPTLKEWQYAARGGLTESKYLYAGANNARKVGWYSNNSRDQLKEVGKLQPNELGLYDMCGNIGEIVRYQKNSDRFLQKGGFFDGEKDYMEIADNSIYGNLSADDSWYAFGFRCVKDKQ